MDWIESFKVLIVKNIPAFIAILISLIALVFSLLKDFILPCIRRPKLNFKYENEAPFLRYTNSHTLSSFLRIRIKNVGKSPALNCRCQILKIMKNNDNYGDYTGFPIRWSGKPENDVTSRDRERLNISRGEIEFLDVATSNYCDNNIHLCQYHKEGIGIKDFIEPGKYEIILLFSGDNFKPQVISFMVEKDDSNDPKKLLGNSLKKLKWCKRKRMLS